MVTIYALKNLETGYAYIGCTAGNVGKRMREHRCLLKQGKHAVPALQADWLRLGQDKFKMETLETLPADAGVGFKRAAELRWMGRYRASGKLYNLHEVSYQGTADASRAAVRSRVANGYRPSAESNLKRRLAQLGVPKGHGAKISATKRARRDEIVCSTVERQAVEAQDKEPVR